MKQEVTATPYKAELAERQRTIRLLFRNLMPQAGSIAVISAR